MNICDTRRTLKLQRKLLTEKIKYQIINKQINKKIKSEIEIDR